MKYTIKVSEVNKESNIRAMATVVFDDSFKVGSIAVVERKDGRNLQFKVSVNPFERQGSNIRGIGRIYLNDNFVVNNVSVLQGKENLFVAMPSYKTKQKDEQGKAIYQDVCYPVTKEFREVLYGEVINSYNAAKDRNISKGEDDFMVPGDTELPIMENGAR